MYKLFISLVALLILSGATISALDEHPSLRVMYYDTETTFESLEAEGLVPHCVTESSPDLLERDVFDFAVDQAICFDTIAEADTYMYAAYPYLREQIDGQSSFVSETLTEHQFVYYSSNYFTMFRHNGYSGYLGDILMHWPVYTYGTCSVWRTGSAVMRLYKGINFTGASWTVTSSHWTLGSWCPDGIQSIKYFF